MAADDGRPAQPRSILRGHKTQVHAAAFVRDNERLITGDADGYVIAWDLAIMRPRAVWRAHENSILGIASWGRDSIITHGRDHKLIVWKLGAGDEAGLSATVPLDETSSPRPNPWIIYVIEVNTMNFCTFSHCPASPDSGPDSLEVLIAVPNTLASEAIDIFHLPSQSRRHTVKLGDKNGMVMALSLFYTSHTLTLIAAYENGMAVAAHLDDNGTWTTCYQATSHTQPILSLDVSPQRDYFITSSADALIVKHPLPPPSPPTASPPPVASPSQPTTTPTSTTDKPATESLLSALLSNSPPSQSSPHSPHPSPSSSSQPLTTTPLKILNTKHAGQQSLTIRSDGRLFATAGWDARIRIYSAKTLREVAVLKWHQAGCYAVAFARVDGTLDAKGGGASEGKTEEVTGGGSADLNGGGGDDKVDTASGTVAVQVPKLVDVSVRERRLHQAKTAHWVAAGSKDGKVSLWDVF